MSEPIELEHVRILRLQPGDTVVLELETRATTHELVEARARLKRVFPDNECLVICGGSLSVTRATDADASTGLPDVSALFLPRKRG